MKPLRENGPDLCIFFVLIDLDVFEVFFFFFFLPGSLQYHLHSIRVDIMRNSLDKSVLLANDIDTMLLIQDLGYFEHYYFHRLEVFISTKHRILRNLYVWLG